MKMKVFNYSELHFAKVTFYKIHTLVKECNTEVHSCMFSWQSMKCSTEIQISPEVLESPTLLDLKTSSTSPTAQHTNTLMHVLFIINGMQHGNSNLGRGTGATRCRQHARRNSRHNEVSFLFDGAFLILFKIVISRDISSIFVDIVLL